MSATLEQLLEDGVIDEVVNRLKSGKEADVWLVRQKDGLVAAKVYKDRATRSFKNSSGYKEGRAVRNTRTQRAMDKGSRFGQAAAEDAWKAAESDALHRLHADGVRVPAPVLFYDGILLMELVLDEYGQPAPRLIDAQVPVEYAAPIYEDLRSQAIRMLCCDLIHGDLSPYNILLGVQGPTIIDFPQVVGASHNSQAEEYFVRDIRNLQQFFAAVDPKLDERRNDGAEIWRAYVRRELTPDFVPTGRMPPPKAQHHGRPQGHAGKPAHAGPRAQHGKPQHAGAPQHAPHHAKPQHGGPPQDGGRPQHGKPQHGGGPRQDRGPRPQGAPQQRQEHAPRPHGAPRQEHAPRPHGAPPQQHAAPRPHGAPRQEHAPRPHGAPRQEHAPRPHGAPTQQHAAPRPHGAPRPDPRPEHAPRPHNAPAQQHAPRPHGAPRQEHAPRPHTPARPHADRPAQPAVERVTRPPGAAPSNGHPRTGPNRPRHDHPRGPRPGHKPRDGEPHR